MRAISFSVWGSNSRTRVSICSRKRSSDSPSMTTVRARSPRRITFGKKRLCLPDRSMFLTPNNRRLPRRCRGYGGSRRGQRPRKSVSQRVVCETSIRGRVPQGGPKASSSARVHRFMFSVVDDGKIRQCSFRGEGGQKLVGSSPSILPAKHYFCCGETAIGVV
jgi:hypothetical protein